MELKFIEQHIKSIKVAIMFTTMFRKVRVFIVAKKLLYNFLRLKHFQAVLSGCPFWFQRFRLSWVYERNDRLKSLLSALPVTAVELT